MEPIESIMHAQYKELKAQNKNLKSPGVANRVSVIIDEGHGNYDDERKKYYTPPSIGKFWKHPFGTLYEGLFNRIIGQLYIQQLAKLGIPWYVVNDDYWDTAMSDRVKNANIYQQSLNQNCFYQSIHGNAFNNPAAKYWSVWTTPGVTRSDFIATDLYNRFAKAFPNEFIAAQRMGKNDGNDPDYEERFYVLAYTNMPAILSENFFYTNPETALKMANLDFCKKIAECHAQTAEWVQGNYANLSKWVKDYA